MILVTGATGFVGRRLVKALTSRGMAVRSLVHTHGREAMVQAPGVEVCFGDVLDGASLRSTFLGVEAVVHLVAIMREKGERTFYSVNHRGTACVVRAAREAGAQRMVHVSVIGAADKPALSYLRSRWLGEQEVMSSGISYTILRSSIAFGEGDEFVNTLAGVVKALPVVPVAGTGRVKLQPIHVDDLVSCICKVAEDGDGFSNELLELGGPEHITYEEMLVLVARTMGLRRLNVHVPLPFMWMLAACMAPMPQPPLAMQQLRMIGLDNITRLDSVETAFGFRPRTLQGNIDYVKAIRYKDAARIALGFMPRRIRDH